MIGNARTRAALAMIKKNMATMKSMTAMKNITAMKNMTTEAVTSMKARGGGGQAKVKRGHLRIRAVHHGEMTRALMVPHAMMELRVRKSRKKLAGASMTGQSLPKD